MSALHRCLGLALVLTLAGCAAEEGSPDPTPSASPTDDGTGLSASASVSASASASSSTSATTAPRPAQTIAKDVTDNSFPEGTFMVQKGDTVRWTHRGTAPHSVTSTGGSAGDSFDSHPNCTPLCMTPQATYDHKFEKLGDVTYHCKVHGDMTGTITVVEALPA